MNSFNHTFLLRLAVSQRSKIGLLLLIFPLVSWSNISNVHASASARMSPRVAGQQTAQASESDGLVQAAYELYQKGRFDEALAKCSNAAALNPNDFRPHAIAALVW